MEESKGPKVALSDKERFPLISDLSFLNQLKQDIHSPIFNFQSGDRLDKGLLDQVKNYDINLKQGKEFWKADQLPVWLENYLSWCRDSVPFYKQRSSDFLNQPTIRREDIRKQAWAFVSMDVNLEHLLLYQTSGSTGPAMDVLFDPVSQACWIPQVESILKNFNIEIEKDKNKVAIAMICAQEKTLTYASLSTYLEGAGILKINLNEKDWNDPNDIKTYLEKYNPQILTGDPIAFTALANLNLNLKPKALISSAMKLMANTKSTLEKQFNCPVIDLYSLTECRNIAYATSVGYRAIRPDLYLEIFDKNEDKILSNGEVGELVVTGGNNPFLPLIRYRTGDFCSLKMIDNIPYLQNLEARAPVNIYKQNGSSVNNIDITRALAKLPIAGFHFHQNKDKSIEFTAYSNEAIKPEIQQALSNILGQDMQVSISLQKVSPNKGIGKSRYTTD